MFHLSYTAPSVQWSLPPEGVVLRPREVVEMKFFYRPVQRCKPFHQEVTADIGGVCACGCVCVRACMYVDEKGCFLRKKRCTLDRVSHVLL
eukprot:954097-Pelagomonas_calceolata.AAC.4